MMKKLFILMMMFSILLSMSSNNLMMLWMSLEINMISFIPLMINKFNYKINTMLYLKYFMIQSVASMLFFFINLMIMLKINIKMNYLINFIMMNSMMLKLGLPPYHFWYIKLMKSMTWLMCIILSIIQKIIPMLIIMKFMNFQYTIMLIIILSSTISVIMGLKQTLMKLIMAYSSINHLSWMLMLLMINEIFMIKYFLIYSIISTKLMMIFKIMNINSIKDIYQLKLNKFSKMITMMNILSLGSLPPLMGFLMKWYSLIYIMSMNKFISLTMIMLLINSSFTLIYYLNLITPMMFIYNKINKLINFNKMNMKIFIMNMSFTSIHMMLYNSII